MSKPDAYEEYEPLQSVTPRSMSENQTEVNEKSAEQQLDEMSIASHSGEQLMSPVMDELKSKMGTFDDDTDIPNADYPVPPGSMSFSVIMFLSCSAVCFLVLFLRRRCLGGELGGQGISRPISAVLLIALWFIYILFVSLEAYELLQPGV